MKALEGVKIFGLAHVQSGPACTQLPAWFGADVIQVDCPGVEYAPGTKKTMCK